MASRLEISEVKDGLDMLKDKVDAGLTMYGETVAKDFESYAKAHRPWTDRTGEARRRLKGYIERVKENGIKICLAHGVEYGIWLEIGHEKRYAILVPTVLTKANDAIKGFREVFNNIRIR